MTLHRLPSPHRLLARKGGAAPLGLQKCLDDEAIDGSVDDSSDEPAVGQSEDHTADWTPVQLALVSDQEAKAPAGPLGEPPPPASLLPFALHRARREQGDSWELVSPGLLDEMAEAAGKTHPGEPASEDTPREAAPEPVSEAPSDPGAAHQPPSATAPAPAAPAGPIADSAWRVGLDTVPTERPGGPARWIGLLAGASLVIAGIAWWSLESQAPDPEAGAPAADPGAITGAGPIPPSETGGQGAAGAPERGVAAPAPKPAEPPQEPAAAAPADDAMAPGAPDAAAAPSVDLVRVEPNGDAVIAGRAAPHSELIILDNGEPIGSVKADAFGEWVFVPDAPLAQGGHEFGLVLKSEQGKVSIPARPEPGDPAPAQEGAPVGAPVGAPSALDEALDAAPAPQDGADLRTGQDGALAPLPPRKPFASPRETDLSAPIPGRKPESVPGNQSSATNPPSADFVVQLASVKTLDGARREWRKLQLRFPDVLAGMDLKLHETKLAQRGTVVRVRTGPFSERGEAADFCARIRAGRQDCLVVRANDVD